MVWLQRSRILLSLWPLVLVILRPAVHAQNISTSGPVPPLQWINITGLTSGSAPPALRDASIGYYAGTSTLLIFGGESAQGIVQSQTYLLNLETLTWSQNNPPTGLDTLPPARSAAISGDDSAASYRSAHIVIGGMGSNGQALSDVWEFDYISQFWSEVTVSSGGPSARYGAVGGKDLRTPDTASGMASPNNSFYLAGGISGNSVSPLSDVWQLDVTGTLSSNNPNSVEASWKQLSIQSSNTPSKVGAAGAVVSSSAQDIIAFGGCTSNVKITPNESCARADPYIISTGENVISSSNSCPAPRLGATLVTNSNGLSSDFSNQVFLVFGLFNSSLWSDDGGLAKGEVDVLNVETGVWNRVLPAGDPGQDGTNPPAFPSPRQGAVGLSSTSTLVGTSGTNASDSIFFGGVDADGNYLNEVWVLRAYSAQITQTNQSWASSSGQLVGGVGATGQGVTVQFMSQCASALSPQATQTSAQASATSGGPSPTSSLLPAPTSPYDTSVAHKSMSPISLALIFVAVIGARLATASVAFIQPPGHVVIAVSSVVVAVAAYALGVAGLATSFTTITSTATSLSKRSSALSLALKTGHGKAGLALFIIFYFALPLLFAIAACFRRSSPHNVDETISNGPEGRPRVNSTETAEKEGLYNGRAASPLRSADTHTDKPRPRTRSWAGLSHLGVPGRRSSESTHDSAVVPSPSHHSFEVVNRPARTRRASANSLAAFSDPRRPGSPRNLGDTSWFDGRRSMSAVGEFHYPLNDLNHRPDPSTPGTTVLDMTSTSGLMTPAGQMTPEMPRPFDCFLHALFHASLLALCILSLIELWRRAPRAAFVVFLIGTLLFYVALVALSWSGKPRYSILTVLLARLRGRPTHSGYTPGTATPSRPLSAAGSEVPFPTEPRSPYQHYPPYRAASTVPDEYPTSGSHGHAMNEVDDDGEEDEDTRQRRIEDEMSRRDVSIVTVPRRKLFLTNPELDRG
ncbi:uncharacterized protein B0H18DRAFT_8787 [Fomitopsis serialis]|uniref:uncharacterized protein n=1 Tax=Fomitopsis serialis TaxID=139415 RepID=UPI0020084543|nr:uncharacterized protein B0H18DRAFT_8787 [Neoantrodia serialis]KAH9938274.1 hypothetical protein B0H18DRAFT_8787 [Neoantrodia serialis]